MRSFPSISAFSACLIAALGCHRAPEPERREAPPAASQEPAAPVPAAPAEPPAPKAETAAALHWSDPAGWERVSSASPMRLATYRVPKAAGDAEDGELTVFHFPSGKGGDVESNLSRWEQQIPDGKPKRSERTANGLAVHVVSVERGTLSASPMSAKPEAPKAAYGLLAAMVETPSGPFFFKLTAPAKTVKAAEKDFLALLDGVKLDAP